MPRVVYKRTAEMCVNISAAAKNVPKSSEHKAALSVAQKKRYEDPAEHEKISAGGKRRFEDPAEHEKMRAAQIRHYEDPAAHEKLSIAVKKRYEDPKEHEKTSAANIKRFEDPAERDKISVATTVATKKYYAEHPGVHARENNGNWNGGSGDFPYDEEFTPSFKESVRADGNHTCQLCGKTQEQNGEKLCVHHCRYGKITKDDTFVALCRSCNSSVNKKSEKDYWTKFFIARLILAA